WRSRYRRHREVRRLRPGRVDVRRRYFLSRQELTEKRTGAGSPLRTASPCPSSLKERLLAGLGSGLELLLRHLLDSSVPHQDDPARAGHVALVGEDRIGGPLRHGGRLDAPQEDVLPILESLRDAGIFLIERCQILDLCRRTAVCIAVVVIRETELPEVVDFRLLGHDTTSPDGRFRPSDGRFRLLNRGL